MTTLLTPECGSHCGAKESAPRITFVGHCSCKLCHKGKRNTPNNYFIDRRNQDAKDNR